MSRADRRKQAKFEKKSKDKKVEAMRWFKSLPVEKYELIQSLVKMQSDRDNELFIGALERCYTASISSEFEEAEWERVESVMEHFAILTEEDANTMKSLREKCEGDMGMANKIISDLKPQVEKTVRELLKDGANQKEAVETLKDKYPTLSKAMIVNIFKVTKEIVKAEALEIEKDLTAKLGNATKDTDAALEYIFEKEPQDKKADTYKNTHKAHSEESKASNDNIPKEENTHLKTTGNDKEISFEGRKSNLKVINEVVKVVSRDIQGEFGTYKVENKVVEVDGDRAFGSKEEVKEWAKGLKDELQRQMELITACEAETIEVIEQFVYDVKTVC